MKTILTIAALVVAAQALPAKAATFKPAFGGKTIIMTGDIVKGDAERLNATIKAANDKGVHVERLFLNSPGGEIWEGIRIGAVVEHAKIDTVVGATDKCSSSCVTVFAAGRTKAVFPTSRLGVHSATAVNMKTGERREDPQATVEMIRFYKKVGVPASVLGKMVATEPGDIAHLDLADYNAWGVEKLWPTNRTMVRTDIPFTYGFADASR